MINNLFILIYLMTPMKMWIGKPANYSFLHMFGSLGYVMYNSPERVQLNQKFRKCIFFGYVVDVKGYRLWSTAHKVVVRNHMIFREINYKLRRI